MLRFTNIVFPLDSNLRYIYEVDDQKWNSLFRNYITD